MVDIQAMTVRLPADLYEKLRREAFEAKRSMNELIAESIAARYAKEQS